MERLPRGRGVLCALLKWQTVCQVMVANIRCAEIMEDQLRALGEDQAWLGMRQEAADGLVPRFGERAAALLDSCLSGVPLCNPCRTSFRELAENPSVSPVTRPCKSLLCNSCSSGL